MHTEFWRGNPNEETEECYSNESRNKMGRRGKDSYGPNWDKLGAVVNKVTNLQVARYDVLAEVLLKDSSVLGRDAMS